MTDLQVEPTTLIQNNQTSKKRAFAEITKDVNVIEPEEAAKKTRKIEIKVGLELDSKEELKIGEKD